MQQGRARDTRGIDPGRTPHRREPIVVTGMSKKWQRRIGSMRRAGAMQIGPESICPLTEKLPGETTGRRVTGITTGAVGAAGMDPHTATLSPAVKGTAAEGLMPVGTAETIVAPAATGNQTSQTGE